MLHFLNLFEHNLESICYCIVKKAHIILQNKFRFYYTEHIYNHTSYVLMLYCADVDTSIKKDLDTRHKENY